MCFAPCGRPPDPKLPRSAQPCRLSAASCGSGKVLLQPSWPALAVKIKILPVCYERHACWLFNCLPEVKPNGLRLMRHIPVRQAFAWLDPVRSAPVVPEQQDTPCALSFSQQVGIGHVTRTMLLRCTASLAFHWHPATLGKHWACRRASESSANGNRIISKRAVPAGASPLGCTEQLLERWSVRWYT